MRIILVIGFLFLINLCTAQQINPDTQLRQLNGDNMRISEIYNDAPVLVILFWATWCKPCVVEMDAISEVLDEWKSEVNFRLIAVSIDDSRSSFKIKSFVNGKGWDFDVFLDENQNFKREVGVQNIPFTIILRNNKIEYKHSGYFPGDEALLFSEIKKLNE